ncbi:MAG: zf-HC2 domain-containing protein [Thermoleophilia bacterium]
MTAIRQRTMDALVGSCEQTAEQLSDHLEGDLKGVRRLRVALHLSRCEPCRALLRSLGRTVDLVRGLGGEEPTGPSVADEVARRIGSPGGGRADDPPP